MIPKYRMWNEIISRLHSVDGLYFDREVAQYKDEVGVSRLIKFQNAILMQSTGLYDKNGKEIFEGDIITNGEAVVDVKNHLTLGFYTTVNGVERFFGDNTSVRDFNNDVEDFSDVTEIIGNIYENPELLEATE